MLKSLAVRPVWTVIAVLALITALVSFRWALFPGTDPEGFIGHHFPDRPLAFLTHVIVGPVVLILGITQFLEPLWRKHIRLHRLIGGIYVTGCLIAAAAAMPLALNAAAGPVASWGFAGLAAAWFGATLVAYLKIRARHIRAHREWMIRSYALTLAAVTIRLYLSLPALTGWDFVTTYQVITWACWLPNLVAAELYIRRGRESARQPAIVD